MGDTKLIIKIKSSIMKHLSIILLATIVFASCKRKDTLETDKNIVIMTDTSRAGGSYLSDTGLAKMPVAVAPVAAAPAPTRRTTSTRQRSSSNNNNTSSTNNNSNTNSGSGTTTQPTRRTGISKAAKGAIIGGVGGAVIGGVVGKNAKGAIIGGAAGAAGGYILGRSKDRRDGRIP